MRNAFAVAAFTVCAIALFAPPRVRAQCLESAPAEAAVQPGGQVECHIDAGAVIGCAVMPQLSARSKTASQREVVRRVAVCQPICAALADAAKLDLGVGDGGQP